MFERRPSGNTYYYGSDTHRYINELIGSSGEILIVSPYIDPYYASMLTNEHASKRFYVIASSLEPDASDLLKGRRNPFLILGYAILTALLLYVSMLIGLTGPLLIPSFIPLAVGVYKHRPRSSNIILKVPKQFVHAKIYISDRMAITGSVNLTYKGTHRNVEQINIMYDDNEIRKLREQFWSMWNEI